MAYQLTADDIHQSLMESGIQMPEQKKSPSFLDKAGQIAGRFNEGVQSLGLPNLAAHLLSAPLHTAANIANVPGEISNKLFNTNVPRVEVPGFIDPLNAPGLRHTPTAESMGFAGDLLGSLLSGTGAYKGIEKALNLGSKTPLAARALAGGAAGAATSDNEKPGGRLLGAAIGAALPAASGLLSSTIGKRASQMLSENTGKYKALYDKILSEGEKSGASKEIRVPSMLKDMGEDIQKFFKHTESQKNASLNRFINTPSLENAHKAQSDLGKIIRTMTLKNIKGENMSSGQSDALEIAKNLQKRIRGSIQNAFSKVDRNDLAKKYSDTTKGYGEEVVPLKTTEVKKLQAGMGSPSKTGKSLIESNKFSESAMAKQLPGYGIRRTINQAPTWAKAGAAALSIPALNAIGVPVPYYLRKLLGG